MSRFASRRHFMKKSLTAAGAFLGTLAASSAWGKLCRLPTPPQSLGPFFPDDGDPVHEIRESQDFSLPIHQANDNDLTFVKGKKGRAEGQAVTLRGRVLSEKDGDCVPQKGAVVILWNASATGRYNHRGDEDNTRFKHPETGEWVERQHDPHFQYWGRCLTDAEGNYEFRTIVPGYYPIDPRGRVFRPPHLHFLVSAPGRPQKVTQLYFKGEAVKHNELVQKLNSRDFILRDRRLTREEQESLIVEYRQEQDGTLSGRYDFILT